MINGDSERSTIVATFTWMWNGKMSIFFWADDDEPSNGLVVSTLGIRTRGPWFESWVVPVFHWVAALGKLFTHTASAVSQLQRTGVLKGVFGA